MPASTTESSANGRLWTTTRRGSKTGSLAMRKAITSGTARKAKLMDVKARRTSGNEDQRHELRGLPEEHRGGIQQQQRRHGQRQRPLVRPGPVAVAVRAGVVLDERQRAERQRDGLEPQHGRAEVDLDGALPEDPQHRRRGVGEHDEPEPEIARQAGPVPAGPREDGHEVQEGRRVPADERAIEVQVRAEERAHVALWEAEQIPDHGQRLERREPEEGPRGAQVRAPPDQQEGHERSGDDRGEREGVEPHALPDAELHGRERQLEDLAVALDDQADGPPREPPLGLQLAELGPRARATVHEQQPVAFLEQAPRGRPHDVRDACDLARRVVVELGADTGIGRVGEEARQGDGDGKDHGRHGKQPPGSVTGVHEGTLPYGGRSINGHGRGERAVHDDQDTPDQGGGSRQRTSAVVGGAKAPGGAAGGLASA